MQLLIQISFWGVIAIIVHSYVFYPLLVAFLSRNKQTNRQRYLKTDNLPEVAIIMAVHNEQAVIVQKLESIFKNNYPAQKIRVYVGSDHSTDHTNRLVERFMQKHPISFFEFQNRRGKAQIINELSAISPENIQIFTDANVFFSENLIFELVQHFKNPLISMVGATIQNPHYARNGISLQEKSYMQTENRLKHRQSLVWKHVMGVFGGCFALRKQDFRPVPPQFIADDFFLTLNIIDQHQHVITEPNAICFEDVSHHIAQEFRRKARIAVGNFQNLRYFKHLLWPPFSAVAFSFWSHKVFRWFTPLAILLALFFNLVLIKIQFYQITFYIFALSLGIPVLDYLLQKIKININIFRFITHFYAMNVALLVGLINYFKGVKTNVWQPTQRKQLSKN